MKGTKKLQKQNILIFFFCMFGCFFCCGCGLETIVIVQPPITSNGSSLYSTTDPLSWFCDFVTEEEKNDSLPGADFIGTEVYYRIYKNYSTLSSHKSGISQINTTTNTTAAATRLIETYKYQPLGMYPEQSRAVFAYNRGSNTRVYFRLKTVKDSTGIGYRAAISRPYGEKTARYYGYDDMNGLIFYDYDKAADSWTTGDAPPVPVDYKDLRLVVPYRTISVGVRSFDFFDDNETKNTINVEPVEGDIDYEYSSTFTADYDNTYFVQLYAVGVALDTNTCANTYSLVLDLGTIPIQKGK